MFWWLICICSSTISTNWSVLQCFVVPTGRGVHWTARSHWHCILLRTLYTEDNSWSHGVLFTKLLQKSLCRILKLQVSLCCFVLNNHWFFYKKLFVAQWGFFAIFLACGEYRFIWFTRISIRNIYHFLGKCRQISSLQQRTPVEEPYLSQWLCKSC